MALIQIKLGHVDHPDLNSSSALKNYDEQINITFELMQIKTMTMERHGRK